MEAGEELDWAAATKEHESLEVRVRVRVRVDVCVDVQVSLFWFIMYACTGKWMFEGFGVCVVFVYVGVLQCLCGLYVCGMCGTNMHACTLYAIPYNLILTLTHTRFAHVQKLFEDYSAGNEKVRGLMNNVS